MKKQTLPAYSAGGAGRMNAFDWGNYFFMFLIILCMVFPLYYCLIVSISDGVAVTRGEVIFYPIGFNLAAYQLVFKNAQILRSYANTILYTALGTGINILMTALCAYPLSRPRLRFRRVFNALFLVTMFLNGGMIPLYLQIKRLGLINSVWAVVLPGAISTYNMIIMRTFFGNIPEEMHEAADIDGASQFQVFLRIVLPLSETIIATLVLFYAVSHWNSYLSALLYLNDTDKMPLQMILRKMVIDSDIGGLTTAGGSDTLITENKLKYAIVMISVLPMLVIYPFLQRYFVNGVMIGSVKG